MFKLRSKIVLSFSGIIIISTVLMILFINNSTRSGYEKFAKQNDLDFCLQLVPYFQDFYSSYGSWDNLDLGINIPGITGFHRGNRQMRRSPRMEPPGSNPPPPGMFPPVVLTDNNGLVLLDSQRRPGEKLRRIEKSNLDIGVPVMHQNNVVGLLFAGSMIGEKLSRQELIFLNRIRTAIILISVFILLFAIVFAFFFSWRLTKPIVALSNSAIKIRDGNYLSRVKVNGNDELADLGRSFNQMALALDESDKWRKQIIADSAHELRTPVSLIQGNLEMILDGVYKADDSRIQNIYDETLVLSRLISELQELSSAEAGNMKLKIEDIDPLSFIDNILEIFKVGEKQQKITLKNSLSPDLPTFKGDSRKLKQVFSNVLANAFRHTPENGEIEVLGSIKGDSIVFKIKDSGSGIKEEDLDKIFERFYRIDSARNRKHGGSGLGLAISKEIIKLHMGEIYAESTFGNGTTIVISIPAIKE